MSKHLLSICIPTNGVSRWVIPTLENLYSLGADESSFEVVVADNGGVDSDLAEPVKKFEIHDNFRYVQTNVKGFYNIIENFVQAKGDYMIKLNHRCILHKGSIEYIISQAEKYYDRKPLMFFSNENVKIGGAKEYSTFDDFLYDFSYWSSLSEGLFFWKEDIERVPDIKFAPMSPNVSLMFDSRRKNLFVLDDSKISHNQESKGKYGYDLFNTFAILYLDLINDVRISGDIKLLTFIKIKQDTLQFLMRCYYNMKYKGELENYSLVGMKESMNVYYSKWDYYWIIARSKWTYVKNQILFWRG